MKENVSIQPSAGTNNLRVEPNFFPGLNNEVLHSAAPDGLSQLMLPQDQLSDFTGNNPLGKIVQFNTIPLTTGKTESFKYENQVIKFNGDQVVLQPFFNMFLKTAALHLSSIELAIYNYDLSRLRFATNALKNLFFNINIPIACRHLEQMEYLVEKNNLDQVNDLFLELKKIIAQIAQYSKQLRD